MSEVRYQQISAGEEGQRLDNYLMRVLKGVPKSHIYRIIRGGEVRVNKKRADVSCRLQTGDLVRIPPVRTSTERVVFVSDSLTAKLSHCVLYEDKELLVINKPAGLAVHGGSGLSLGVIEALRQTRTDLSYLELVHRLDRDTAGCLLLAKKRSALRVIQAALAAREVQKTYWALLDKSWQEPAQLTVDAPLQKNILKSGERLVTIAAEGKPSVTLFKLLENYDNACLVAAMPMTGRTHQIRVHSASLHHPIVGDEKYGYAGALFTGKENSRLYLHARAIQFNLNGKNYNFEAELDESFTAALQQLRRQGRKSHE